MDNRSNNSAQTTDTKGTKKKSEITSTKKLSNILQSENCLQEYIDLALKERKKEISGETKKKNLGKKQNSGKESQADNELVEDQLKKLLEHLYSLKFKLEKEKGKEEEKKKGKESENEKKKNQNDNIKVTRSQETNKNITNGMGYTGRTVLKNLEDNDSEDTKPLVEHVPELIETIEIYKNRNIEEQKHKKHIIEKYESMLRNLKNQHIKEINDIKNTIFEDVDFLIQKYRNVSFELYEISKRKEKKHENEKKKITDICINACKKFEEDVKAKARASLQEYKDYMTKVNENLNREKENLERRITDLRKNMEEEKLMIEKRLFESCEKNLKQEYEINKKLNNQIIIERHQHNAMINTLYTNIDQQIKIYEENIIKVVHGILTNNNIHMSLDELYNLIKNAMDEEYKKEKMKQDLKKQEKIEQNKLKIKYGFNSIMDQS